MSGPTAEELRDATVYRILRAAYLRAICSVTGQSPGALTESLASGILEPHDASIAQDTAWIREVTNQAYIEGLNASHARLHSAAVQEFTEHAMLDEALQMVDDPLEADYAPHPRHLALEPKKP